MLTKVPSFYYVYKADAFHRDEAKRNRDGIADLTRDALLSRWSICYLCDIMFVNLWILIRFAITYCYELDDCETHIDNVLIVNI